MHLLLTDLSHSLTQKHKQKYNNENKQLQLNSDHVTNLNPEEK